MASNNIKEIMADLLEMEENIDTAKNKKAKYEGKLSSVQDQLKKDFGCDTKDEAIALKDKLDKEICAEEEKIEKEYNKLVEVVE